MRVRHNRPKALVVTDSEDFLTSTAHLLSALGIDALAVSSMIKGGTEPILDHGQVSLVVIDLDALGDLEEATEKLLLQRMRTPHIPTIIASRKFLRDDYGSERIWIADASTCFPFGRNRLATAISQALVNNSSWMSACHKGTIERLA